MKTESSPSGAMPAGPGQSCTRRRWLALVASTPRPCATFCLPSSNSLPLSTFQCLRSVKVMKLDRCQPSTVAELELVHRVNASETLPRPRGELFALLHHHLLRDHRRSRTQPCAQHQPSAPRSFHPRSSPSRASVGRDESPIRFRP